MTRPELRMFMDKIWGCACGCPELACATLLKLLRLHPMYEHWKEFEAWVPDSGLRYFLLYTIDKWGLTEHGTSVGGQWLTDQGKAVMEALAREEGDEFEALMASHCIHGYDTETEEGQNHDCYAEPAP